MINNNLEINKNEKHIYVIISHRFWIEGHVEYDIIARTRNKITEEESKLLTNGNWVKQEPYHNMTRIGTRGYYN